MKGLEKLDYPRLAKVLSQEGKVSQEILAAAMLEHSQSGTALTEILVRDGLMSEWDLARVISQEFNLPILLPSSYTIEKEILQLLPPEMIWRTKVIPLDRFGSILAVAMPLLSPCSTLTEIAAYTKLDLFPYVSPTSEIARIIDEKLPAPKPAAGAKQGGDWEKLFDEADQAIKKGSSS